MTDRITATEKEENMEPPNPRWKDVLTVLACIGFVVAWAVYFFKIGV